MGLNIHSITLITIMVTSTTGRPEADTLRTRERQNDFNTVALTPVSPFGKHSTLPTATSISRKASPDPKVAEVSRVCTPFLGCTLYYVNDEKRTW